MRLYFHNLRPKVIAVIYGMVCHGFFLVAGILMFIQLFTGFSGQLVPSFFPTHFLFNIILLIQFPIFHSFFLTKSGKKFLRIFYSERFSGKLDTTVYATIASVQLIVLFLFWTPSDIIIWVASGSLYFTLCLGYFCGWLALSISSIQAGFGVQTGSLGWISVYRGVRLQFPDMPTRGLFAVIRHPIYFSFCIILWVSPYLTADKLLLASSYSFYCLLAPLLKEKRFVHIYGDRFLRYKLETPYFFPRIFKFSRRSSGKIDQLKN